MKITQDVREYAASQGIAASDALAAGLQRRRRRFGGGQALYVGDAE